MRIATRPPTGKMYGAARKWRELHRALDCLIKHGGSDTAIAEAARLTYHARVRWDKEVTIYHKLDKPFREARNAEWAKQMAATK